MGGIGLHLLVLDVADVEHEHDPAALLTHAQHLALYSIPGGRLGAVAAVEAYAGEQRLAQGLQVAQAAVQFPRSAGWMNASQVSRACRVWACSEPMLRINCGASWISELAGSNSNQPVPSRPCRASRRSNCWWWRCSRRRPSNGAARAAARFSQSRSRMCGWPLYAPHSNHAATPWPSRYGTRNPSALPNTLCNRGCSPRP